MRKIIALVSLAVLITLGFASPAYAAEVVPPAPASTQPIVDNANIFSSADKTAISSLTSKIHSETGHELAVLTVLSLSGESIESFSKRVANNWGVGSAKANDGIVLVLAMSERKIRLEVGSGLSSVISDSTATDIVNQTIGPKLHDRDYAGGVTSGFLRIESILKEGAPPASENQTAPANSAPIVPIDPVPLILIIILAVFLVSGVAIFFSLMAKKETIAAEARYRQDTAEREKKRQEANAFLNNLSKASLKNLKKAKDRKHLKALLEEENRLSSRNNSLHTTPLDDSAMNALLNLAIFNEIVNPPMSTPSRSTDSSSSSYSSYDSGSSYSSGFDSGSFGGGGFDGGGGSGGF